MDLFSMALGFCARFFVTSVTIVTSLFALIFLPMVFYLLRPVNVRSVATQTDHRLGLLSDIPSSNSNG
jgi:hypothetical protein